MADQFASFFHYKIKTIRDNNTFIRSGTEKDVRPSSDPPKITAFIEVPQDTVDKIISPTKSCMLDPWPTFLIKECSDILLPSITKLVTYSLMEGCVPEGFKTAVVSPILKKATLPPDDFKKYHPVPGLRFISKLVE